MVRWESEDLRWLSKWQSPVHKSSHHYGPTLYLRYQPRSFGGDHPNTATTLYDALLLTASFLVIYPLTRICCTTVYVLHNLVGTRDLGPPLEEHTGALI